MDDTSLLTDHLHRFCFCNDVFKKDLNIVTYLIMFILYNIYLYIWNPSRVS